MKFIHLTRTAASAITLFLLSIILASCSPAPREQEEPTGNDKQKSEVRIEEPSKQSEPDEESGTSGGPEAVTVDLIKLDSSDFNSEQEPASAHAKYLNDPTVFFSLEDYSEYDQTAVIGSLVAKFYPMHLETDEDRDKLTTDMLPEGIPIPIATIIPIYGSISNKLDSEYSGFFQFEDNYNYFYLTRYNNQNGLVFGADLAGLHSGNEYNSITAEMYANQSRYEVFPPFTGYDLMKHDVRSTLEASRVALQRVAPGEYSLSLEDPDDMISLYKRSARSKYTPIFITTDLVANSLHLFFDHFLQDTEETFFFPRLNELIDQYLAILQENAPEGLDEVNDETQDVYLKAYWKVMTYIQVADCLMALAPDVVEVEKYGRKISGYDDKTEEEQRAILDSYPENVRNEVQLILAANEHVISPNFGYKEDYTQYKPRGHYSKNGILSTYFRSMMWFGRLHLYITKAGEEIISSDTRDLAQKSAGDLSLEMLPMVAILSDIAMKNPDLLEKWRDLFDPITDLIGMSDDLSFDDVMPLFDYLDIEDLQAWANNAQQVQAAVEWANAHLRPPQISGNSVFEAPSADGRKQPMGFRLFGQRFTWDSYIHQQVSPPRLMSRYYVRGLDIMKVFGSSTADQLLASSDYPEMTGLEQTLDGLQNQFAGFGADFWNSNYYNSTLSMVRTQAVFEPGAGFYFTETPMWGIKSELSSHGTWAALRHDTILYVKQVYAERAGDGDFNPTFRTEPIPLPVHYIEPNQPFFQAATAAVANINNSGAKYGFISEGYATKIKSWMSLLSRMSGIVDKEYRNETVPDNDVQWIRTIPQQLAPLVLPSGTNYASYADDTDSLRSAIVADVFTNAESNQVLEVGTGIPYRIYVALNDGQGRKRIAIGYTFSYYEFLVPQNERMTDEEWRKIVYASGDELTDYLPFWSKDVTLGTR